MMTTQRQHAVSETDIDEFAEFDFFDFTEEDWAKIDADVNKKHLAKLPIIYENTNDESRPQQDPSSGKPIARDSPLDTFRSYGTLSVTDLTSPSWCEVQFEYGLRGKRSRPLLQRPKSFKSASGKEIKTNTRVAARNAVITSKGRAIHKSLEREVKPEEILVEVKNAEEKWALYLVNLLDGLRTTQYEGLAREVPVFGIEDSEVIVGIIDELIYHRPTIQATESGQTAQTQIENQSTRSDLSIEPRTSLPHLNSFPIQIIDTKSRRRPSLPLEEDMLPSRLQLMLYHRLLSRLVSTDPPFDFTTFWQLAKVDPHRQLSSHFLEQTLLVAGEGEFQVLNLADLSVLWFSLVHQLHITIHDELKLIYRLQTYDKAKGNQPGSSLHHGISRPTQLSLQESSSPYLSETAATQNIEDILTGFLEIVWNGKQAMHEGEMANKRRHQILGTKNFQYESEFLSSHLADTLAWWRGERKPRGVPVELTRRCTSCEYYNDCEWREERAEELRELATHGRMNTC